MSSLSDAQRHALTWLQEHNGTGLFAKDGVLIAGGERAETMRVTWHRLWDKGLVTIADKRVSLTPSGSATNARKQVKIAPEGCLVPAGLAKPRAPMLDEGDL